MQTARISVKVLLCAHRLEGISLNENMGGGECEATWMATVIILKLAFISKLTKFTATVCTIRINQTTVLEKLMIS